MIYPAHPVQGRPHVHNLSGGKSTRTLQCIVKQMVINNLPLCKDNLRRPHLPVISYRMCYQCSICLISTNQPLRRLPSQLLGSSLQVLILRGSPLPSLSLHPCSRVHCLVGRPHHLVRGHRHQHSRLNIPRSRHPPINFMDIQLVCSSTCRGPLFSPLCPFAILYNIPVSMTPHSTFYTFISARFSSWWILFDFLRRDERDFVSFITLFKYWFCLILCFST